MKINSLLILLSIYTLCTSACTKSRVQTPYANSIIITNEGNFGSSNGTITAYDPSTGTIVQEVFRVVNDFNLGDVVQSMTSYNDNSFICVNQSTKVEVVNNRTLESVGTITSVPNPRYFLGVSPSKFYISSWSFGAGSELSIIDYPSLEKKATLVTGWAEEMLLYGNKAYVTISDTNEVIVLDTEQDIVSATYETGFSPGSIQKDANNQIWVLFGGKKVYNLDWSLNFSESTPGGLTQIDPASQSIVQQINFDDIDSTPSNLKRNPDGSILYYIFQGNIYSIDISTGSSSLFIEDANKNFYGLGINPQNGEIYTSDALDFNQAGDIYRYNISGEEITSFKAGIIPGGFSF